MHLNPLIYILFFFPFYLSSLTVSHLNLQEKVGQVLIAHFHGEEANEETRELIQESFVGGVIYYPWANGLQNPHQVQKLSQSLRKQAQKTRLAIPLFIAIDQEGGAVVRLKHGFTSFPGNYALAQSREWKWEKESARMSGEELKAVGISLNLAPVVDICSEPSNPVIGIRAFSADPKEVAILGKYALQGYQKGGVIAVLKHFPGHGDVKIDSHAALPVINKGKEELYKNELFPFQSLIAQAEVVMTGHLMVPALDENHCVTFSKKIVHTLLRNEMGFQGVVMTDSLAMEGILSQCSSVEEAALKSLEAGHDLILLGGKQLIGVKKGFELTCQDVKRVHQFIVEAVKQGKLSEKRLDESVSRILALKEKYKLFNSIPLDPSLIENYVDIPSHRGLAQKIARKALHLVKGEKLIPCSFHSEPLLLVVPEALKEDLSQTAWQHLGSHVQIIYIDSHIQDPFKISDIREAAAKAAKTYFFASNVWQSESQQELIQQIVKVNPSTYVIVVRDPIDAKFFSSAPLILCTFSPSISSLQAAYLCLTGTL